MQNLKKKIIYILIAILAYMAGDHKLLNEAFNKINIQLENKIETEKIYFLQKVNVANVVDGDTFDFIDNTGRKDTVRIMAVDTLEKNETDATKLCFAKKQTQFTKDNLLGREVYLYIDKTQGERDRYGRILAYVATSSENFTDVNLNYFYNDYLAETGNADVYKAKPSAILFDRFEQKMFLAKESKLGMWGSTCQN